MKYISKETNYAQQFSRLELYSLLQEGLTDVAAGKIQPFSECISELRAELKNQPEA